MQLTRNILSTLAARMCVLALMLVSSMILARGLGPEGRGLLALVFLLPGLATSLGLLGFEQANAVYAGLEPGGRRVLVWQSVVIAGVVGGIVLIAGLYFVQAGGLGFQALSRVPFWLCLLPLAIVPGKLVIGYWQAILRGMNHIVLLNTVEVGTKVASLVFIVVLVWWLRLDVAGAVWAESVLSISSVVLMGVLLRYVGVWGKPSFDRALWKRTARFAIPAHGGTIAAYLNYHADQFIIAALLPPEQLGFYVMAVALVERLWFLPSAVGMALLPHLANSSERDPALVAAIARHTMVGVGALCVLVFVFADVAVRVLYSSAFAPAVAPLRWLLPGVFVLSVGKVLVAELLVREKPRYTVWASGIGAVVNIVGNLLLIPRMGISGAALASSVSYTLISVIVIWFYLRETSIRWTALIPRGSDLTIYNNLLSRYVPYGTRLGNPASGKSWL